MNADMKPFRKHIRLTALGVALQSVGAVCVTAAALGVLKEMKGQFKKALAEKLTEG